MVAIATDPLKIKFIDLLLNEMNIGTDSHEYFIGNPSLSGRGRAASNSPPNLLNLKQSNN